ncbi:MAG: Ig-like domain-containing protein [Pseudomonadota bacterium]
MATKKTKVVVNSNGRNIDHTVEAAANGKAPVRIKVQKGAKYLLKGDDGFAPENVTLTRVGNDLQITLEGETSPGLVLEGYYAQSEPVGLYGVAEDGQLYAYARTDGAGEIYALAEGQSAPVALGGDSHGAGAPYLAGTEAAGGNDVFGGMLPLLMTGGLAALGLGAIAAATGRDGDTAPSLPPVMPPPDIRPPSKPGFDGIGGAYDDVGPIQGQIQPGGQTDDTRPDFFGTGTPGNTITMYDNGKEIGKALVGGNGEWHFTPPKDLGEGKHAITITESDPAGRESEPSDSFEFAVDTTPPPKPDWNGGSSDGPGAVIDDVGSQTGRVPPGGATDDQRPDFDGQGTPGDTIIVLDHGQEIGRVEVGGDGKWTFTPQTDLSEGDHSITIIERDPAGNESKPSDPFEFEVDITPPDQPQVGGANDNMGEYQGPIAPGGVTDDRQPEFHGEGTPGDTIVIFDGKEEIGKTEVDENGAWTFTPSTDLKEGEHSITIIARDPAGNESTPSDPFDFEIDVTPPDASKLAIKGVADDVGDIQGNVPSGGKTDDSRPLISGTGTTGDTIIVTVKDSTGSRELGRAIVDADGKWTLQVNQPLLQGKNEFTAIEMDPTGNHTAPTAPYIVVLDSVPPSEPVIQNVQDDVGPHQGMLQKGQVTDDARPTIIGTAQAGNTIKVYDGTKLLGQTVADANGKWSFTPEANLADGTHNITATSTNPVGQTSTPTGIWNFVVDATPPGQVTGLVVSDDVGGKQGPLKDGETTDDDLPTFSGKAEPGATVNVYDNGHKIGEALVDENGNWSFTPTTPLTSGEHAFTTEVVDPAGNSSGQSDPLNVVVDAIPGVVTIGKLMDDQGTIQGAIAPNGNTDDAKPEIQGAGKPGSTIKVYDGATLLGETTVKPDGSWSFTPGTALADGAHSITVTATDKAGNVSEPTKPFHFTVDTVPPATPSIESALDDVGSVQVPLVSGGVTDDPSPTLSGKAEAGSTVTINDNGALLGTVVADAEGNWSYTPTTPLNEGEHTFTVSATDKAGNTSAPSAEFVLTTDYTPADYSKLAITGVADDVGLVQGNVASGERTDDSRPAISGTGTAGDTIIVMVKDSTGTRKLGEATVGADGKWTLQVSAPLLEGSNEFTAIEVDPAGNATAPSAPYTVILDSVPPSVPVIQNVQDDVGIHTGMLQKGDVTDDARPTIIGTAQAGNTVKVYDGTKLLGETVADAGGKWSFTPGTNLADGTHNITATATNPVGQTSKPTGIWNFVVDTKAPDPVTDFVVTDDVGAKQGALNNGDTTDDNRPTFSGKAEPGSTVNLYDGDVKIGEVVVDPDGTWSFTPSVPLADGEHALSAEVVDPAGNSSGKGPVMNIILDISKVEVSISKLVDDQGSVQGAIAANGTTDDTRPEIQGTGKAGSTVKVYDGATLLGETTVKADGSWTFTPTADLGQGAHAITATATDKAGNVSEPTAAFNFSIDTIAPTAPSIESVTDDVGAKQGALVNGGVTDDPSPTLSGKAEAGSTVTIKDNGAVLGTVVADAQGNWSYTPTTPLAEGEHKFTVTATDKAGNTSAPSAEFVLNTDYTPPDASKLAITGVEDDVGGITGNVASGATTDDALPAISGTGTAGDTIIVMVKNSTGTHKLGEATVGADGKWTLQVTTPLAAGANEFTAIEQDPAGNQTAPSAPYGINVDTGRPEVPVIQNVQDDVGIHTGMLQKGEVTDDARPTIIGTAQAGNTIKVYDGAKLLGQTVADASGKWSFTPEANLADGTHNITTTATNPVGQTSDATGIWNFVVDTKAPDQVTGLEVIDDVGAKQGTLTSGDTTDDNQPEFKGKAEPGATVNLYDGDTKIGEAVADENGNWSITPTTPLGDGSHSLSTEVVDPAGNASGKGPTLDITVDTSKVEVSISKLMDDQGSVQGAIVANGTTDDKRPEIQGTGKAGSTIKVYDGATLLGETTVKADGSWTFTPTADLGQGAHAITATATDKAGNVSEPTAAFNFSIDTIAPTAPSIESVTDDVGAKQGALVNGGVTDDPSPTLSGKAEAGSTVVIKDNNVVLGQVTADAEGKWSFTPTTPLAEGEHKFTVTATDKAGNTSTPSAEFVLNTDYTPPDASKLAITGVADDVGLVQGNVASGEKTDDSRPAISGTGTAGDTIIVMVKDSTGTHKLGEATVGADGKWTLQVTTPLLEGSNEFTAIEVDPAGNQTAPSAPYTVILDSVPPSEPVIQNVQDDVGANQGMLQKGQVTDDAKPTIIGTAQPGHTVKIYDNGTKIGEVVADAGGKWSFTPGTNLADGTHNITATATNAVGQTSKPTGIWNFVVDTTPPGNVTGLEVLDDEGAVQGPLKNGDTTDDNKPEFKGKAEPGATVNVYDGGTLLGSALVDANGDWSFTPSTPLANGSHALTTEVVDPAGNSSGQSAPLNLIVDTIPGELRISALVDDQGTVTGPIAANGITDDKRPEIQGTGKAGSTVKVYDGATLLGETVIKADGTWSFTPTADLGQGAHAITAIAIDKAGNPSDPTKPFNFTVDTVPPAVPSIDAAADDVGAKQGPLVNGGVTDDPSPTLSGKAEAGSTVTIKDNGAVLGTVVADANGDWVYTPTTPLTEETHTFTVTATDKAGNTSAPSAEFVLTTDYTPADYSKLAITGVADDVGLVQGNVASGGKTDDSRPAISGTGTAGDTIIVMVKDSTGTPKLGEATVGADGKWTLQVTTPLLEGSNEFTAIEVDPAGNQTAPSAPYTVILDSVPPSEPVIQNVQDDVGANQGMLQKGQVTDDAKPTIIGTAQAGHTVKIYDNGTKIGEVVADAGGKWSFTPETALADGTHNITATATNPVGQTSKPTGIWNFVVDTVPPGPATGQEALDDVGAVQGPLKSGDTTDDSKPEFKGKAEPGATVNLYDGDEKIGEAVADPDGNWSITPTTPLGDGTHSLSTEVVDPAGNSSGKGPALDIHVDTSKVEVSISKLVDDQGSVTGAIAANGTTDDKRPEIQGTGKAGSTIKVYDGATLLGETTVKADGSWTFTPTADLGQGAHAITATATDKAGNVSEPTAAFNFSIDTIAPTAPSIESVTDDVGAKQGALVNGGVTDDPSPTLSGKAEAGSTVVIKDNNVVLGTVVADAEGKWSFTPTTPLPEGEHKFTVTATDKAGNTSAPSAEFVLNTDYTPPDASKLAITGVEDDVGGIVGNVLSGSTTDDSRPVISGTGTAGDTIIVTVKDNTGSRELGRTTVGADGKWTLQVESPLLEGSNEFTAIEQDPAGNQTAPSAPYTVILDSVPPSVPVIQNVQDDVGIHTGMLQKGEVTDDAKPTIIGTAQAGNTIKVYDGATLLGQVVADASGKWSFTPETALADGPHDITATATNSVGQTSDATGIWNFVVDTAPPGQVTGLEVLDDVGAKTGPLANGDTTDDTKPTFNGKAEPGATVKVYDNGTLLGSALVDGNGDWTFTPTTPLVNGPHALTTEVVDPAGNSSGQSAPLNLIVDIIPGTLQIDTLVDDQGTIKGSIVPNGTTDDTRPEIQGTGKAGSTVKVYDGATLLGQTVVKADGSWTFTPTADLGQGAHAITATATDLSGNPSGPTSVFSFTVDTVPPTAPSIDAAADDVGAKQGPLVNGGVTDDPSPTLSGKAEAGSSVTVKDNGAVLGTVVANANGDWVYTPTTPLAEGEHKFTVTATDKAGNTSPASPEFVLTTDYTPPPASAATLSDDVGEIKDPITSGTVTDDDTPTYAGKTEPNATVTIYDDGKEIGKVQANATGDWSFTPSTPLAPGAHSFSNAVTDVAGNVGQPGAAIDFTVDVQPATVSIAGATDNAGDILGPIDKGGVTDDTTPTLYGKATPGGTVKVYDGTTVLGTAVADANGDWSFTPATALREGSYELSATVTTAAHGESAKTAVFDFTVDLTAPAAPTIVAVLDDVGSSTINVVQGGVTDDTRPQFKGKAEANSTVKVYDGATLLGQTTANAAGDWSFTPATPLANGAHNVTATATDKAGNLSVPSNAFDFSVDTVPPPKPTIESVYDDVGSIQSDVPLNGVTDDPRPDFKGKAEANSTVVIYDKGVEVARVQADASGNWTWTPAKTLTNAVHTFTVKAVDDAGNISAASDAFGFTVATTPPPKPVIVSVYDDVGSEKGDLYSGDFTDDTKPLVTGKAEASSTVIIYNNGVEVTRVQSDASGNWTYTPATALADGGHSISAIVINKAGVSSVPSAAFGFTVDTTPPAKVVITGAYDDVGATQGNVPSGDTTDDKRPTLSGTGEVGAVVTVKNGSTVIGTATVGSDGKWSLTPASDLALGNYSFIATQADKAGNVSASSNPYGLGIGSVTSTGEDFEATAVQYLTNVGSSFTTSNGLKVSCVVLATNSLPGTGIYATSSKDLGGAGSGAKAMYLRGSDSQTRFDFNGAASELDYTMYAVQGATNTVSYYDAQGTLLGTQALAKQASGDLSGRTYSFSAPAGKAVAYMVVASQNEPDGGIVIDSVHWSKVVVPGTFGMASPDAMHDDVAPDALAQATHLDADADVLNHATQAYTESDDMIIARLGYADRLEGGAGNDTFAKVGTGDTVHGGAGDDVIRVNSGDFAHIDGGLGVDTLVMDGKAMHIDLSALGLKVQGVEKFDLGAGGNTLALSTHDVLAGGARDMVMADGKVQMLVNGANGDVNLLGGDDSWAQGSNATVGGVTYSVYTNLAGTAELLVEDKVHVTIL